MADAETVVDALRTRRERREAAALLDAREPPAAAGQHLVRVRLVAHVPDQPVIGRVEDVVKRDRELDRAEAGRKVAAHLADGFDEVLAQLVREGAQVAARQCPQVGRRLDRGEQALGHFVTHGGSLLERGTAANAGLDRLR